MSPDDISQDKNDDEFDELGGSSSAPEVGFEDTLDLAERRRDSGLTGAVQFSTETATDRWRRVIDGLRDLVLEVSPQSRTINDVRSDLVDELVAVAQQVGAEPPPTASEDGDIIRGDVSEVALIAGTRARALAEAEGPTAVASYIRGSVARTIDRLERTGGGSPERCVDIVVTVLDVIQSRVPLSFAEALFRYLAGQSQQDRGTGYYVSAANVAGFAALSPERDSERSVVSAFMYHTVLAGMRDKQIVQPTPEVETASAPVFVCATNLMTLVQRYLRGPQTPPEGKARVVLQDLMTVAGAWPQVRGSNAATAKPVLVALGLQGTAAADNPIAAVTAVSLLSRNADYVEGLGALERAYTEASGAVVNAAPATFFNAGVSLRRVMRRSSGMENVVLLINALGLQWAVWNSGSVSEALLENDGLDLAVNLLGTLEDVRDSETVASHAFRDFARELAGVPDMIDRIAPSVAADTARLRRHLSGMAIESRGATPPHAATFGSVLIRAISSVSKQEREPTDDRPSRMLWSARAVRAIFSEVMDDQGVGRVDEQVMAVAEAATRPVETLIARYERYVVGEPAPFGPGPLLVAAVVDPTTWSEVGRRLSSPLGSVAPLLYEFSLSG
jgi:hypothetical protein